MPDSESNLQRIGYIVDVLSKLAAFVAAFFAIQATISNQDIERQLKELDSSQKKLKLNQDSLAFDREFKFKIYDLAITAIKSKDSTLQDAAYVAVNSMMTDTAFRSDLLGLFAKAKSVAPAIRKAATVAKFDIKESKAANPVYSPKDKIYVDIIYLEDAPRIRSIARKIFNALQSSESYEVGIKPLLRKRNELPVYQIQANQIRYDADEKAKAEKLMEVVNQILPDGAEPFTVEPTQKGNPTKQYISLFVVK